MPVIVAAICPHPPLLLPSVASGAAAELDDLRSACDAAIERVYAAEPEMIVVIGSGSVTGRFESADFGSFDGFGVRETYALGGVDALAVGVRMPLSLAIGAWLLHERPTAPPRHARSVADSTGPDKCGALGADIATSAARVGLVVMGDGSACRGEKSPGYADPRAEAFDASIVAALAAADPSALLRIDPVLAAELLAAGRTPWQVLAGAVAAGDGSWRGEVLYDDAPYGVCYPVASWQSA